MERKNIGMQVVCISLFLAIPFITAPEGFFSTRVFRNPAFGKDVLTSVLAILFFYFHYLYLLPKFYFQKKYLAYIFLVVLTVCVVVFMPNLLIHQHMQMPSRFPAPPEFQNKNPFAIHIENSILKAVMAYFMSFVIRNNMRIKEIENAKNNSELALLKGQIQPHFLFNTLNGIYSLALNRSDNTANAILQLSNMLRYTFINTENNVIPLKDELEYVQNYISLQELRLNKLTKLNFSIHGTANQQRITPLIFIPFIENAIKYGVSTEYETEIIIKIDIEENAVHLFIQNKKHETKDVTISTTNLGIINTRKRLDMLYPKSYELEINEENDFYTVNLKIWNI